MFPTLIVGLGNPGERYRDTRHNAGFMVVDRLASVLKVRGENRCASIVQTGRHAGRKVVLAKPQTFMNLSGTAVAKLVRYLDLSVEELFIVYDCLDLPLGRIRLRGSGSSGGHRGVDSVVQELGTERFGRLRIGIGRPAGETVEYVLAPWTPEERATAEHAVAAAAEAVLFAVRRGIDAAMNHYNAWEPPPEAPDANEGKQGE